MVREHPHGRVVMVEVKGVREHGHVLHLVQHAPHPRVAQQHGADADDDRLRGRRKRGVLNTTRGRAAVGVAVGVGAVRVGADDLTRRRPHSSLGGSLKTSQDRCSAMQAVSSEFGRKLAIENKPRSW